MKFDKKMEQLFWTTIVGVKTYAQQRVYATLGFVVNI
jgi:hypothetical protein